MRVELISPEGLRVDGRRAAELRRIECKQGVFTQADGSALVEQGNTKVLAAVYGPREPQVKSLHDRAMIHVNYNIASFSTGERKQQFKSDRRIQDIEMTIKHVFEAVILTHQFPRSEISICLQVVQVDGGALHTAINAATLALIDAGIPMLDYVCACSASFANDTSFLDLNYIEESSNAATVTLTLLPRLNKLNMIDTEARISLDQFQNVIELGMQGCQHIHQLMDTIVRDTVSKTAESSKLT